MKKFWNWKRGSTLNADKAETEERILELYGIIAEESWFDDEITPKLFREELNQGSGDITVWINSPGGDCIAAAQIYNLLREYQGRVRIKIDGIAASAASVIAMAGDTVLMSPVSMMMIHNPITLAFGDHSEMQKAIHMLSEVKESIINAYAMKTGLSRARLSHLMDSETWMDANKAVELGFADDITGLARRRENPVEEDEGIEDREKKPLTSMLFSRRAINSTLLNKLEKHYGETETHLPKQAEISAFQAKGRSAKECNERLNLMKKFI